MLKSGKEGLSEYQCLRLCDIESVLFDSIIVRCGNFARIMFAKAWTVLFWEFSVSIFEILFIVLSIVSSYSARGRINCVMVLSLTAANHLLAKQCRWIAIVSSLPRLGAWENFALLLFSAPQASSCTCFVKDGQFYTSRLLSPLYCLMTFCSEMIAYRFVLWCHNFLVASKF